MLSMHLRFPSIALAALLAALPLGAATPRTGRFALILQDEPAAKSMRRGGARNSLEVLSARQNIRAKQASLRRQLESSGFHVTGATDTLLNAVYVVANRSDMPALLAMPGVRAVFPMLRQYRKLNAAATLLDAPNAWSALGGIPNAGAGMKIGILDTGIDQTHPAFQDSTLQPPAGFPKSDTAANLAFTNNKVIVARSYVSYDVTAFGTTSDVTTPDDQSARDRVGHGTAVAMCAGGNTNTGPLATITGLAPHAFLGNYKIFGSPGINDGAYPNGTIQALEDAFNDGMDVVNISSGGSAFSAPLETGSFCDDTFGGSPCDPEAIAVQNAVANNMVVVTAGGNEGNTGFIYGPPTYDTVGSPGYAPDAIAVAASGNSHVPAQAVELAGPNLPSNLAKIAALEDDGIPLSAPLSALLIDAGTVGDQFGCNAFPANSMVGEIALIERGGTDSTCIFATKLQNAQDAGAVGVLFYNDGETPDLISPLVYDYGAAIIPSFFIGTSDGQSVKTYVDANQGTSVTLDPTYFTFVPSANTDQVTEFSSRGPALGFGLKPDVVAPGENIYMATQTYDPQGELYNPSGYVSAAGTSFSSPMVAGIAALVRQSHPTFSATQVKSAIVNTAVNTVSDPYVGTSGQTPAGPLSVGGGKADALNAIQSNVTVEPATLSFGLLAGTVSSPLTISVTNFSAGSLTVALTITRTVADPATQLTLSSSQLTLQPGVPQSVTVTLSGTQPAAGVYYGAVTITGGAQALHVPYYYVVGDGVPYEIISLAGDEEVGAVGQVVPDGFSAFQVLDKYGVPVPNLAVTWTAPDGSGSSVTNASSTTDKYGQAFATTTLGTAPGLYDFIADIAGFNTYDFQDEAFPLPVINTGGVVNAASNSLLNGIAPGSYISIYGSGLAVFADSATYVPFPISLDYTSVGFDAPGVSLPGAISYISDTQVNVQVPWELAGQSSVDIKVDIEPLLGQVITVPVATYSPAMFVVNGIPAAINVSDNSIVRATNAAVRGQYVSLYCNGLGPVANQPATGAVALSNPLSNTLTLPTVTIGGAPANVEYSGLTPGAVGLYQINVQIPTSIAAGSQPVIITIGGITAPALDLPVR